MSSLIFPLWFVAGLALIVALPVTTAILAIAGIAAYRIRRRDPARPLTALKWTAVTIGPFWVVGVIFGCIFLYGEIRSHIDQARRYFTLDRAAEIDGVALPAGTRVELDESLALRVAELPTGAAATLRGASWQGKIEFATPAQAPRAKHGQITEGILAADATIDAVPCRAGSAVTFFWGGQLMGCTLSQDSDIPATLTKPGGATSTQKLRCLANDTVALDGLRAGELGDCRLAATADFGDIACAAGERILISTGDVAACTFAHAARFGPLPLPAGAAVTYYDHRPSNFRLPAQGASVEGFGLTLPPGTEGAFCYRKDAPERLTISRSAYVTVASVKLTGFIEFDCKSGGAFESGLLFEDAVVGGKWRERGAIISRDDLLPKPPG